MKKKLGVFIGRFQPFHNGHLKVVDRILNDCDNLLIIVGSAFQPRTIKNPFTTNERRCMINDSILSAGIMGFQKSVEIDFIGDHMYNDDMWCANVQEIVSGHADDHEVLLYGHAKDDSSFYLKMFPQWKFVDVGSMESLSSTDIRNLYFSEKTNLNFLTGVVPTRTLKFLENFKSSQDFYDLYKEKEFITAFKKQYEHLPYPITFNTADAVVTMAGHVLMVKRKEFPGKGLWALPGGYLNANTDASLKDAAIRELKEETKIDVPKSVLKGSIVSEKVFDGKERSLRGRIITLAFHIKLNDPTLPKVKGSDDAEIAKWIPLSQISPEDIFEDHYDIINYFTGI